MKLKITSFTISTPHKVLCCISRRLTLNLLTTTIVAPPSNASKWQMGFNSAFKGLSCKALRVGGFVSHKGGMTAEYNVLVGKREGKRPLARWSGMWNYNIKMNLKTYVGVA